MGFSLRLPPISGSRINIRFPEKLLINRYIRKRNMFVKMIRFTFFTNQTKSGKILNFEIVKNLQTINIRKRIYSSSTNNDPVIQKINIYV